jgi:hypothetical protein
MYAKTKATRKPEMQTCNLPKADVDALVAYLWPRERRLNRRATMWPSSGIMQATMGLALAAKKRRGASVLSGHRLAGDGLATERVPIGTDAPRSLRACCFTTMESSADSKITVRSRSPRGRLFAQESQR